MSDKALMRNLDGQLAIFVSFVGDDDVIVNVGGKHRTLKRTDWQNLPPPSSVPTN